MNYNKVQICGINTGKLIVLNERDKMALLKKAHSGDAAAREQLINGNLRLVLSVIQRFMNRKELPDDLFQVGCVGLIKAIDNFDTELGVRFSTYAVPMIIGELRRFLRDNNPVRVSRSVRDLAYRAMQRRDELQATLGREPSVSQIASALGEDTGDVVAALDSVASPVSIYEPMYSERADNVMLLDTISGGEGEEDWITEIGLKQSIARLSERERLILSMRYSVGRTQTDVAKRIGISQAQVSRLEKNALEKIKKEL